MAKENLTLISEISSISSVILSFLTFVMIKSVKKNLIQLRRKQRIKKLIEDIRTIPSDAFPSSSATVKKIEALGRNLSIPLLESFSEHASTVKRIKKICKGASELDEERFYELKESINDYESFQGEL